MKMNYTKTEYPLLRVNLQKIKENAQKLRLLCAEHGIGLWAVSKGISAFPEVARAFEAAGIDTIADSRLDNIRKLRDAGIKTKFALIRIPMLSELEELAELCDYTLISETGTIKALSEICERTGREISCVVMFDMGDLREGFWCEEAEESARQLARIPQNKMKIVGIGANFSCASGVLPTKENLEVLSACGKKLEKAMGRPSEICSGGGTCSYVQLVRGNVPSGINNLRIGEAILLGTDTSFGMEIEGLNQDTMRIEAELVEVRKKPTLPVGEIGHDAFGNVPVFEDRGDKIRGILALGKQDVNIGGLVPLDDKVRIITASSDHLLVDIDARPELKTGDILAFRPDYTAMLSSSTSPYVKKIFE